MPSGKLTEKQEMFARYIVEGMNQSEAFRMAYPNNKSSEKTIWERASVLANTPKVKERIAELRDRLADATIKTAQERLMWLSNLIDNKTVHSTDKLRAVDIMNKMTGEYVTKIEGSLATKKLEDLI